MQSEPSPTPSVVTDFPAKWKPKGKMVKEEGGVRFMDSYLWASIHEEVSDDISVIREHPCEVTC